MKRINYIFAIFAFALMAPVLPSVASAQWGGNNRRDDDYYGNGRYNRNINATVKNLRNRSREFVRRLDRELDRSRYDDRRREDQLNDLARQFASAADNLEDSYDNGRNNNRSQSDAQRVLSLGNQLDRAISRARLSYNVENDWSRIRQDLSILANAYGYDNRNNRRNGRNDRNDRNDDWRRNIPFPFPF